MKIIATDNQNRDYVSEKLIAENVNAYYAEIIVDALNEKLCNHDLAPYFYVAKADDYKPYVFVP